MATVKFKAGDTVQVKDWVWYSENQYGGNVYFASTSTSFVSEMSAWCGKTLTIKSTETTAYGEYYIVGENHFAWTGQLLLTHKE